MPDTSPRERLVDAAADLFYRRGYHAVGVNELCRVADVRKGSFYYYFDSKEALAAAALDRHRRSTAKLILEPAFAPDCSPADRIVRYFDRLAELNRGALESDGELLGCPFGNMSAEVGSSSPAIGGAVDDAFGTIRSHFRQCLADAHADGGKVDPDAGADTLLALMEGTVLLARSRRDPELIRSLGRSAPVMVGLT